MNKINSRKSEKKIFLFNINLMQWIDFQQMHKQNGLHCCTTKEPNIFNHIQLGGVLRILL